MCILFLSAKYMSKERPLLQPNELSDDAKVSMRKRVIFALIGIFIVLPFIIFGDWAFFALIVVVLALAIIEIIHCAKTKYSKVLYIVSFILAFLILLRNMINDIPLMINGTWRLFESYNELSLSVTVLFVSICLLSVTVLIDKNFTIIDAGFIFTSVALISLGVVSFMFLRFYPVYVYHDILHVGESIPYFNLYDNLESFFFIFYMALGACLNDAFAYFVGVFFGKHKMNPRISPKKTWEGFFGGVILAGLSLCGMAFAFSANGHPLLVGLLDLEHWYHIVFLSFLIPLVSTLGDLFFSSVKRHYEIKDFSNLIPGHGGLLDRLDSLMFAAITMSIYVSIFTESGGNFLP